MKKIEFVRIDSKLVGFGVGKGVKYVFEEHKKIIKEKLEQGFEYKGFIPVEYRGTGDMTKMDLVFEKES